VSNLENLLSSRDIFIPENFDVFKKIFKHFRGKKVGEIPGDKRPLLERTEEFYRKPPQEGLLQGDILSAVSPLWIDSEGDPTSADPREALVLSNECDTENREDSAQAYIRLCPVYNEDELLALDVVPKDKATEFRGNLKANNFTEYFWMPPLKDKKARVADIGHFYSADLNWLNQKIASGEIKRVASLSEDGYFLLLIKLAWFMLRPVSDTQRPSLEKYQ